MENFDKVFFDKLLGAKSSCYFAHLPKPGQARRKPELLSEHSALTIAYAQSLANANGLNSIVEHLINDSIPSKLQQRQLLAETLNKWFWRAIAFHDNMGVKHIFFVAETKGSLRSMDLKGAELAKIDCARKLFNNISTSKVRYHEVTDYQNMLDEINSLM